MGEIDKADARSIHASPLGAVTLADVNALVADMRELREVVQNISGEDSLDRELIRAALTRIDAALAPFARKGE